MSVFKNFGIDFRLAFQRREHSVLPIAGRGGIETTVDQTLMRGLDTAGPWFVSGLPLSHVDACCRFQARRIKTRVALTGRHAQQ